MKRLLFYFTAFGLHAALLFGFRPAVVVKAKEKEQYLEVSLAIAPPAPAPVTAPQPQVAPPPPESPKEEPLPEIKPEPLPPEPKPDEVALPTPEVPPPAPTLPQVAQVETNSLPAQPTLPAASAPSSDSALPAPGQYLGVTQPSYARYVEPTYPPSARRQRQQGRVTLVLFISKLGSLDKVEVMRSSSYPLLDEAAVTAINKCRFHPAYQNNTPIPSRAEVSITFQLQQ